MSAHCQLTGREPGFGHSISHSHRRTKRRFDPNIQHKRYWLASGGRHVRLTLSANGLANRPDMLLAWDAAGASLAMEECGPWLAALRDERWEVYTPERRAAAALDWHPVYGDRIQQLVFTAPELDEEGISGLLDSCLLTDEELQTGESGWKALPDAFEDLFEPVN